MHAVVGFILGATASLPAGDVMVMLCVASMFAVGSGITGYILTKVEMASRAS
jgi:hypothetical protein